MRSRVLALRQTVWNRLQEQREKTYKGIIRKRIKNEIASTAVSLCSDAASDGILGCSSGHCVSRTTEWSWVKGERAAKRMPGTPFL